METETLLKTFNRIKLTQLNELRKENEFCDLTLKCEDGYEIKVHRVVVSCASNYFKNLLTASMKGKCNECISLPDITADILEKIITFIYTNEFEEKIEDIEKIIKYAAMFQLQQLVEICSLALSESITDHNCLKYWRLARLNNRLSSLQNKSLAYIAVKAEHLFESSLMSDLTIEEMRSLLADDRLHIQCDEIKIFEYVWKWAKTKISETKIFSEVFSEVVDLFNYTELNKEFFLPRIFFNDDENIEPLQKIVKLTKPKCKDEDANYYFIYPKPTQRLFGLTSKKMYIGLGEVSTIEKETNLRRSFGYTTFDNKLFICGGGKSSCEFYEPNTQNWKKFPSMKTKKKWPQCSYLDNKIYVCDGIDCNIVEIFDLGKGEWNFGPEMLSKNSRFGLTGINGALYAIGGKTNNVEILDPRTQKWNIVYNSFRGVRVRCVSIGPYIYCFTYEKRYIFDSRSNRFIEEIFYEDFSYFCNFCELDGYIYGLGYHLDSAAKFSLNLIQYHLDGNVGFKKSYGLYNSTGLTQPAVVSLYY